VKARLFSYTIPMNAQRYALLLHKWRYSLDVTTHAGHLDKVKYLAGERNAYIELRKEMILRT
jgi:hypothetical protein